MVAIDIASVIPGFFSLAGSVLSSLVDSFLKVPASFVEGGFGEFFLNYFEMIERLIGL